MTVKTDFNNSHAIFSLLSSVLSLQNQLHNYSYGGSRRLG